MLHAAFFAHAEGGGERRLDGLAEAPCRLVDHGAARDPSALPAGELHGAGIDPAEEGVAGVVGGLRCARVATLARSCSADGGLFEIAHLRVGPTGAQ